MTATCDIEPGKNIPFATVVMTPNLNLGLNCSNSLDLSLQFLDYVKLDKFS